MPAINFVPLWDYVLVEVVTKEEKLGKLHLPGGTALEGTKKGLVVAAGPGTYRESGTFIRNPIQVGDEIYYMARSAPISVVLDGKPYLCLSGRDCMAIAQRKDGTQPKISPEDWAT